MMPKLRFPEFRDAGEWEVKRLGDLIETMTPPKKLKTSDYLATGRFPVVDQSQDEICGWINDEEAIIKNRLPLVVFGDHTCVTKIAKQPFAQGADGIKILANKECIDPIYLYQYLLFSPIEQKQYKRHFSTLKKLPVYYSKRELGEQQKIAHCLSSLDEVIELEARKLDALKTHKKGLMQQLLPAEGETTPRLRFPEFRDAGEWEVKRVGSIVETITPPKKLKTNDYLETGRFPVIDQSQDEICGWTDDKDAIIKGRFPLVIFGDHTCTIKIAKQPFAQGADGIKILGSKESIDPLFLYQYLLFLPIEQKQYKRHFSTLKELPVYFPKKELGEQQKIANCLSFLDEVINLQAQKLETLKQYKKGLMQQLFPQAVGG